MTSEKPGNLRITIGSSTHEARQAQEDIEQALAKTDCSERDLFSIKLALEEALVNAIKHGNQHDPSKHVRIECDIYKDHVEFRIADEGEGFDPAEVPDPTAIENLDRPCGRGLMLMRHYMTQVEYEQGGTVVAMSKTYSNGE